jgi:hypothetical protein
MESQQNITRGKPKLAQIEGGKSAINPQQTIQIA